MRKLLLLYSLHPLFLFAQSVDVRGTVSDSTTGERIPYANVIIAEINKGAAANASGFYLIPNVPHGTHEISASAVGFKRQVKTIVVKGSEPMNVSFRLAATAIELEEVVVSEHAKPELLEIQTSVHVVDKQELRKVPVAAQPDLLRSIQILPGIISTSDVNAQFYVRGGASDQNLILLEGMKIYNPFHAFGLLSSFDPDIIRSVEVYTGAFPTEFGTRLSSVVNIAGRDGNAQAFSGQADVNFISSKVLLEGPLSSGIQTIFTARKSLFSGTFKTFLKESVPLSFYDAFWKVTLKDPDSEDNFSAVAFISDDALNSAKSTEPDYHWSSRAIGVQVNALSQDRLYWTLFASAGEFTQERISKNHQSAAPSNNSVRELNLRANLTYYTDSKNLYFFGFEINFPSLEYNLINRLGLPVRLTGNPVEFASWARYQSRWGLLRSDIGVRLELGTLINGQPVRSGVQPRLNFSLDLQNEWRAKLALGRFSQNVVTVSNEDDVIPIFQAWIYLPTKLDPERADHFVAGLEGPLMRNLFLSVQGYYKHYSSIVSYNRDKIDPRDPDYINAKGKSYGGEALFRYTHPILDVYGAYTLSWVTLRQGDFTYSPRFDRRHTLNLLATAHLQQDLNLSFRWEYGSGLPYTQSNGFYDKLTLRNGYPDPFYNETGSPITLYGPKNAARLPSYHRFDANLSYRRQLFGSVKASFGANLVNLYDRKNIFYFDRRTGQRVNMLPFFPSANIMLEF